MIKFIFYGIIKLNILILTFFLISCSNSTEFIAVSCDSIELQYQSKEKIDSFNYNVICTFKNSSKDLKTIYLNDNLFLKVDSILIDLKPTGIPNKISILGSDSLRIQMSSSQISNFLPMKDAESFLEFYKKVVKNCKYSIYSNSPLLRINHQPNIKVDLNSYSGDIL